jgi:hypothetical protein
LSARRLYQGLVRRDMFLVHAHLKAAQLAEAEVKIEEVHKAMELAVVVVVVVTTCQTKTMVMVKNIHRAILMIIAHMDSIPMEHNRVFRLKDIHEREVMIHMVANHSNLFNHNTLFQDSLLNPKCLLSSLVSFNLHSLTHRAINKDMEHKLMVPQCMGLLHSSHMELHKPFHSRAMLRGHHTPPRLKLQLIRSRWAHTVRNSHPLALPKGHILSVAILQLQQDVQVFSPMVSLSKDMMQLEQPLHTTNHRLTLKVQEEDQ